MFCTKMAVALLLQVLLLAGSSWQNSLAGDVQPSSKLSDGVYTLQLASTNCFLTYQNRTCAKNVPVVRPKTTLWNKWAVRVVDKEQGIVTLKTSEDYGRCPDGTLSRFAGDACQETQSATAVGIVGQTATPALEHELFQLVPVDDPDGSGGLYHVVAIGKQSRCARYLGATGCTSGSVGTKLAAEGEEGVLTIWGFSMVQGSAPAPSPVPAPVVPSTTQAPAPAPAPTSIPGPVIEPTIYGQSIVTSGLLYISVESLGGSDACSVVSVTFTTVIKEAAGASVNNQPSSTATYDAADLTDGHVTIPLVGGHRYEVYAVGTCSRGGQTEMSNILTSVSVVSSAATASPLNAPSVTAARGTVNNQVAVTGTAPAAGNVGTSLKVACVVQNGACPDFSDGGWVVVTTSGTAEQVTTLSDGTTNLVGGTTYTCWSAEFDATNRVCSAAGAPATAYAPPNFDDPLGVALMGSYVYVTNSGGAGTVTQCAISGTTVSGCTIVATLGNFPFGIWIDAGNNRAYVVQAFPAGVSSCAIPGGGGSWTCTAVTLVDGVVFPNPYPLTLPRQIAVSPDGTAVFITSGPTGGSQIVTSCTLTSATLFTSCATTGSNFNAPRALAFMVGTSATSAFVTNYDSNSNSVTSCVVTGQTLGSCAANSVNVGRAASIALDGTSWAYAVAQLDNTIKACPITDGSPATLTSPCTDVATGLSNPAGIALDTTARTAYFTQYDADALTACDLAAPSPGLINCVTFT